MNRRCDVAMDVLAQHALRSSVGLCRQEWYCVSAPQVLNHCGVLCPRSSAKLLSEDLRGGQKHRRTVSLATIPTPRVNALPQLGLVIVSPPIVPPAHLSVHPLFCYTLRCPSPSSTTVNMLLEDMMSIVHASIARLLDRRNTSASTREVGPHNSS